MAWEPPASDFEEGPEVIKGPAVPSFEEELSNAEKSVRMNTPIKPTKWNNYETRTPKEILATEGAAEEARAKAEKASKGWEPPASDFQSTWEPPESDFIPYKDETQTPAQTMVSGAVTAVNILNPFVGKALGGVQALSGLITDPLYNLATKGSAGSFDDLMANAARRATQYDSWDISGVAEKLGVDPKWVRNKMADVPAEKLAEAAQVAGEWVMNKTGSPGLGATVDTTVQAAAFALLFMGGIKALNKVTIKDSYNKPTPLSDKPEPGPNDPVNFDGKFDGYSKVDPEKKPNVNWDNVTTEPGAAPPKNEVKYGNEIDYYPDNPDMNIRAEIEHDKDAAWMFHNDEIASDQQRQFNEDSRAWRDQQEREAKYSDENWQPSQQSSTYEKFVNGLANRLGRGKPRSFRDKQRGQINQELLDDIAAFGKFVVNSLMRLPDKPIYTAQQVQQELNRADISPKEKAAVLKVLGDKSSISAQELAKGVGESIVPLEYKSVSNYAYYGLEKIGIQNTEGHNYALESARSDIQYYQGMVEHYANRLNEVEERMRNAIAEPEQYYNRYDIEDRLTYEENLSDYHDVLIRAQLNYEKLQRPIDPNAPHRVSTNLWLLPEEVSDQNHFGESKLYAHTRSFDKEHGRYIVEIQSDPLQKLKALSEAKMKKYEAAKAETHNTIKKADTMSYLLGEHKFGAAKLLFDRLPQNLKEILVNKWKYKIENYVDFQNGREFKSIFEAEGTIPSHLFDVYSEELRNALDVIRNNAEFNLEQLNEQLQVNAQAAKLDSYDSALDHKNWFKRIVREEGQRALNEGLANLKVSAADTMATVEGWFDYKNEDKYKGIWKRHKEMTDWLKKEYGATEVTDAMGNQWFEVPTGAFAKIEPWGNRIKVQPAGPKGQRGSLDLSAFFPNLDKLRKMWENRGKMVDPGEGIFQVSEDHRPWDVVRRAYDLDKNPLKQEEDLGKFNVAGNVMPIMSQINWDKSRAVQILKNIVSRAQEINNQSIQKFRENIQFTKPFSELSGKEQKALREVQIKYDGVLNDELTNRGLQWMTEDMLRQEGMNSEQIHAYMEETKGLDKAWDMLEEALDMSGQSVHRIPGFFPHFWTGSYKLKLYEGDKLVRMQAFGTAIEANAVRNAMFKDLKEGFRIEYEPPSSALGPIDVSSSIAEGLKLYNSRGTFSPPVVKMLMKFDEMSKRGIIKSALERDANVKGYDAERGFTWNLANNNRILSAYNQYIEDVSHFWRNAVIAKEIYGPYFADIKAFEKTPYLKQAVAEFIQRAVGQPVNHLKWFEEMLRAGSIGLGLPPTAFNKVVRGLGSWVTFMKLMAFNPKFLGTQAAQPIAAAADISMMAMEHYKQTGKMGNWAESYSTLLKESFGYELMDRDPDMQKALDWAKENNKIDVYQADHVNPMKGLDSWVNDRNPMFVMPRVIEERGRGIAFLASYAYFKDILPQKEAYHAAANATDIMMGNYEGMNSSSMFTDLGTVGNAIRPFALIRNAYFGKAAMATQLAFDGIKTMNPVKAAQFSAPLAFMLGSYLVFAGATGFFGFNEWDVFAKMYNANVNPDKPMMRPAEWLKNHKAPDWLTYGLVSSWIGHDVGSSLAAPAMTETAGVPAVDAAVGFWKIASGLADNNMQSIYQGARNVSPPWIVGLMENQWIAPQQGGNIPQANSFDAFSQRTTQEKIGSYLGARALTETDKRTTSNLYKSDLLNAKNWKVKQVSKIVDSMLGISNDDTSKLIKEAIEAKKGFDAKTLIESIKQEQQKRLIDERTRQLSAIAKSNNAADKDYKMELLRRLGIQ